MCVPAECTQCRRCSLLPSGTVMWRRATTILPSPGKRSLSTCLQPHRSAYRAAGATRWSNSRHRWRRLAGWRRRRDWSRARRTAPPRRALHGRARFKHCRLTAARCDGVGSQALLDGHNIARLADNFEGAVVGGGQRRALLVTPDKNKRRGLRQVHRRASYAREVMRSGNSL